MRIEKIKDQVGWWQITQWIGRDYFVATSDNKPDALDRMFRKLEWAEIGNWKRNQELTIEYLGK